MSVDKLEDADFECDGSQYEFGEYDGALEVVHYTGTAEHVLVPDQFQGRPVIRIGDGAFYNHTCLQQIKFPSSITSIGVGAFEKCSCLTHLEFPAHLKAIGHRAFAETNVQPDTIRAAQPGQLVNGIFIHERNALYSFNKKKGMLIVPQRVVSIELDAFDECKDVTMMILHENVTKFPAGTLTRSNRFRKVFIQTAKKLYGIGRRLQEELALDGSHPTFFENLDVFVVNWEHHRDKIVTIVQRLQDDYKITNEVKLQYVAYMQQHWEEVVELFVKVFGLKIFHLFGEHGIITHDNVGAMIAKANDYELFDVTAYLLNYQHEYLGEMDMEQRFSL